MSAVTQRTRAPGSAAGVVLATDLDGTIAFGGNPPGPLVRAALRALVVRDDVSVVLATSRSPRTLCDWFGPMTKDVDMLCCNGALHVGKDGSGAERALPSDLVHAVVDALSSAGADYCLDYGDRFVASSLQALPWMGDEHRCVRPLGRSLVAEGVLKLCVARSEGWLDRLGELAGSRAELYPHHTGDLDLVAGGVSKATALRWITRRPHRPNPVVVAFGNDLNDLDMLTSADLAVVVGDQLPELDEFDHVLRVEASDEVLAGALLSAVGRVGEVAS